MGDRRDEDQLPSPRARKTPGRAMIVKRCWYCWWSVCVCVCLCEHVRVCLK